MYDFYFGTKEEIDKDPKKYLLTIKRMMPRWCNSIPDSEYLAIYDALSDFELPEKPVFVETGSGASTLVLSYFALKSAGELYTWDINGSKLSYIRSILNDTLMRHFSGQNISNHWKYIAYDSNSRHVGISVLKELDKKVSACFLDSEHTLEVLMQELKNVSEVLDGRALVAIDDANYSYRFQNTAYVNMIRKKLGVNPVEEPSDNIGRHFWEEVGEFLRGNFSKVEYLEDTYKQTYQSDLFWTYYRSDREIMSGLNMEKSESLEHRFDAWKVWR